MEEPLLDPALPREMADLLQTQHVVGICGGLRPVRRNHAAEEAIDLRKADHEADLEDWI